MIAACAPSRYQRAASAAANTFRLSPEAGQRGFPSLIDLATGLALVLRARLDSRERLILAAAGLMALDRDVAEELAEDALRDIRAGEPIPPLYDLRDEARVWATFASRSETRAYFCAIWGQLPDAERQGFLRAARPKRRAA